LLYQQDICYTERSKGQRSPELILFCCGLGDFCRLANFREEYGWYLPYKTVTQNKKCPIPSASINSKCLKDTTYNYAAIPNQTFQRWTNVAGYSWNPRI